MIIIVCVVTVGKLLSGNKGCDGANIENCQHAAFQQDLGRHKVKLLHNNYIE